MRRDGRGGILGINRMEIHPVSKSGYELQEPSDVQTDVHQRSHTSEHVKLNWEHLGALASVWSGEVPGVVTGQVVKERLGLVVVTRVCRSLFFLVGDVFRVSSFLPVQRLVVCPFQSKELGSTSNNGNNLTG